MLTVMYTKLFSSLLHSSVWSEDSDTCKVWITFLAMADREGYVFGSPAGIARLAALPISVVQRAIERLSAPDEHSQDIQRGGDGTRIEVLPQGGWRIVNYVYYRDLNDADIRRASNREAQRQSRQRRSASVTSVSQSHLSESEAESDTESKKIKRERFAPPTKAEASEFWISEKLNGDPSDFVDHYENAGWRLSGGKGAVMRDWRLAARRWSRNEPHMARGGHPTKGYPSPADLKEFNKSMVGANAMRYAEVFRQTFGCDPEKA